MKKINIDSIIDDRIIDGFVGDIFNYISMGNRIEEAKQFYEVLGARYEDDYSKIKEKIKEMVSKGEIDDEVLNDLKENFKKNTYKGINNESEKIKKGFKKLGEKLYERFRDNHGVDFLNLFKKNDILVCPYCNISKFELLLDKKFKTLIPSLDHMENKANNGFLSYITIKNLIPSCDTCNSRFKGDKKLSKNCYPYLMRKDIVSQFRFIIVFNGPLNSGKEIKKIDIKYNKNIGKNIKIYLDGEESINKYQKFSFHIKQRIQNYKYEAENFIWESNMVHNYLFKEKVLDRLSNKDYIFYDKKIKKIESIHEIPLSKLYLDIYKQYFK